MEPANCDKPNLCEKVSHEQTSLILPAGFRRGDRRARHLERGLVQRQHADHAATKGQPDCEYAPSKDHLGMSVPAAFIS